MSGLALLIRPEAPGDADAIQRLHERAFGPGRFARTASRLRERVAALPDLSFAALVGTLLVGSVRVGPVLIGPQPALALGPLAVEPAFEGRGIGAALMTRALDTARESGHALVLLIGDEAYYGRFGFRPAPRGKLELPAPVDPARLLLAELREGARELAAGRVMAVRPV